MIAAGLDDDLQNPAGTFTVFAPDNTAFSALATQLGVTVNDLLALPNLADILTYHVLGSEVPASGVTNGAVATPLFAGNTLKLTKTSTNAVYVNHAIEPRLSRRLANFSQSFLCQKIFNKIP